MLDPLAFSDLSFEWSLVTLVFLLELKGKKDNFIHFPVLFHENKNEDEVEGDEKASCIIFLLRQREG